MFQNQETMTIREEDAITTEAETIADVRIAETIADQNQRKKKNKNFSK